MKTTISTIATALLIVFSCSSFASTKFEKENRSADVVAKYLAAISRGNMTIEHLNLAKGFEYHNITNNTKANRKQYSNFLKQTQNLQYNCQTAMSIIDETANTSIAKVSMQFDGFTRVDYITLCLQDNEWKINKVVTTYP